MALTPPLPPLASCLFLDVDGTLIGFSDTPQASQVDAPLKDLLGAVSHRLCGALALVSGRSIRRLDELFAPLRLAAAGIHGVERRDSRGGLHAADHDAQRLDLVRRQLMLLQKNHPGLYLEDKDLSIALHYRQSPECELPVREWLLQVMAKLEPEFHVQEGHQVLEIKPSGATKGTAIDGFLGESPFAGRLPVFIGDDRTDESGFRAVESRGGMSIAVGDRVSAQWRLDSPAEVRAWLHRMVGTGA